MTITEHLKSILRGIEAAKNVVKNRYKHEWREVDSWGGCYCYCKKCDLTVTGTSISSQLPQYGCSIPDPTDKLPRADPACPAAKRPRESQDK